MNIRTEGEGETQKVEPIDNVIAYHLRPYIGTSPQNENTFSNKYMRINTSNAQYNMARCWDLITS